MLPAQHRLRKRADFTAVVRRRGGDRQSSRLLVVHANRLPGRELAPTRVGFVVSKAVGGSVVRNRTKRRLRAQCATRLQLLGQGIDVVIRANPPSASATSAELGNALDSAFAALTLRAGERR